jgi:hypothetical protein
MKAKLLAVAIAVALNSSLAMATAATPTWVNWSSTATGTLGDVNVTLSGPAMDLVKGDQYYNNASTGYTSPTGTYAGLNPTDLIQVQNVGTFTLTFDKPVGDLYMALVSVGQGSVPVTYAFNNPFQVVSYGSNYWGYGGFGVSGKSFTGTEYNGILHLSGNFGPNQSLTFEVQQSEYWHGFNVAAVPEPETYAMMLAGLGLMGFIARRRKAA